MDSRRFRPVLFAAAIAALVSAAPAQAAPPKKDARLPAGASPSWIWLDPVKDGQTVYFRKEIELTPPIKEARLYATCDDAMKLRIDGRPVLESAGWDRPVVQDVTQILSRGTGRGKAGARRHVLAVEGHNGSSTAGLLVLLVVEPKTGDPRTIVSDDSWRVSAEAPRGWDAPDFDDAGWARASVKGQLGDGPWTAVNEASLAAAGARREVTATSPKSLHVREGFKVELLYTVPADTQGSWVNMTVDPKGRLIVSDQYGKLYRVTPPPLGEKTEPRIEPIDAPIGEAQGLLWAFDSLYVVVNAGGKYRSGLYRVRDTDGDDMLDKVEMLRELRGGGEHGPHAVVLGPDGKSLYVVAGNATAPPELSGSLVPRIWGEDQILPFMPDGNGFMADERAPGGCVYRVDPEGKDWVLVSMGYRNPFDLAFNRNGDLFTYDSDMEWDINTPWYRPTRVCQADSGSDLGYRNGSGKWPPYYPDSLPAVVDIGPGSPTGVTFGYGAKFPAKYQDALFLCDWSYGKLYAVHMRPDLSTYTAEFEEFITGSPLPLTDVVVNPKDGAMYFAIGGRRVLSGLYRVTYAGPESTAGSDRDNPYGHPRAVRHKLEAFHGRRDGEAVETAWPYLARADRFTRYAARVAIEFQDVATWRERALAETNPEAALNALLALVRVSGRDSYTRKRTDPEPDPALRGRVLDALERLDWKALSHAQKLALLRVYELALIRLGESDSATRERVIRRLDPLFPAPSRELNAELSKLLVAVQAPDAASKIVGLLERAPTQEEQLDYAATLRVLKAGWTPALREAYFSWFLRAINYKGGASFGGFVRRIRSDALAQLDTEEKESLKAILEKPLQPSTTASAQPARPFVKDWQLAELTPMVENGLTGRDYDRGRALFAAANCYSCHRFNNEGGALGPDLSGLAGRFSPRDLLESIVEPSKTVSDQYAAVDIALADGRVVSGRIVNLHGDTISVNTNMLDPNGQVSVDRRQVEEMKPSKVSMMPQGLLNTLDRDEVLDLMAYLLSRGDRENAMFRKSR